MRVFRRGGTVRKVTAILILAFVITGCSGCESYDNFKDTFFNKNGESEKIRIAVYEPMSGRDSEYAQAEIAGIEMAYSLFPKALDKDVELIYCNNMSDIYACDSVVTNLVQKRPAIVLGSYGSLYSLTASDELAANKIPAIAITNTNPLVTSNNEYYFRVCYLDSFEGVAIAKFLHDTAPNEKVAILREVDDDYALTVTKVFRDKMFSLSGDSSILTATVEYRKDQKDFKGELKKIKKSGAKFVVLAGDSDDVANILRSANELNPGLRFFATSRIKDAKHLLDDVGEEAAEELLFSSPYDPKKGLTGMSRVFANEYRKIYGKDAVPKNETVLGFDSYILAIDAINRAKTASNGEKIRKALASTREFQGAGGAITFDKQGDPIKSMLIMQVQEGKIVTVYKMQPDL